MTAVAECEQSKPEFIGQVLSKSSPVLTWRPVKVQRITPPAPGSLEAAERESDAAHRFSRATTKRMAPPLPVVHSVRGSKRRALRALLTLVTFSLLCGSALTLCVYVFLGDGATAVHPKGPPTRVAVTHVADARFDTLLPAPSLPEAPAAVEPQHAFARPNHGHLAHGRRAPAIHGARSAQGGAGTAANHRRT